MAQPSQSSRALARRIRQHINGREHAFFAVIQPGFEETAVRELREIGIESPLAMINGGAEFTSRLEGCYRVNLCSRTVTRVLMRVTTLRAKTFSQFYSRMVKIPWELYIKNGSKLSFSISSSLSRLYHTDGIESRCRSAIQARLGEYGIIHEFTDDVSGPEAQKIFIRFHENICTVSMDSSGEALYRRGRKTLVSEAPLRETTAACLLREAGLDRYEIMLDPMCGSGTFTIEALEMMLGIQPGLEREFAFQGWPAFRPAAFNHLKQSLDAGAGTEAGERSFSVITADIDPAAVDLARKNLKAAGLASYSRISTSDFTRGRIQVPDDRQCLIVLNPPYGGRLSGFNVKETYRKIGSTIRQKYSSCGYLILTPDMETERALSLTWDKKIVFSHGGTGRGAIIRHSPKTG